MADFLSHKRFWDEAEAYKWVEAHLWPDGPVCLRCGQLDKATKLKGKSTRIGVYKCRDCRKPFTVKVGTIFEDSHIPLRMWLQAIALLCASKKGISSNQLHRMLGVTVKSAWFMSHRIREAMRAGPLDPMGGNGGVVESTKLSMAAPRPIPRAVARSCAEASPTRPTRTSSCRLWSAAAASAATTWPAAPSVR